MFPYGSILAETVEVSLPIAFYGKRGLSWAPLWPTVKLTLPLQNEGKDYLRIQNLPWSTFQLPLEAGSRPKDLHFDSLDAEQTVTHNQNTVVAGLIFNRKPNINRLNTRT